MPFDREAAKSAGYSDAEIDQYLASQSVPQPGAPASRIAGQAAPIAGVAAAQGLGDVLGAAKPLLYAAGGVGGLKLAQRLLQRPSAPREATSTATERTALSAAPKNTASLAVLTQSDIEKHPEFRNYEPGQTISRKEFERIKLGTPERGTAQSRIKIVPKQESPTTVREEPTRPITTEGKPARAPANVGPNGPGVGRGKSGAKLAREAAYKARLAAQPEPAVAAEPIAVGEPVAPGEQNLGALLKQSLGRFQPSAGGHLRAVVPEAEVTPSGTIGARVPFMGPEGVGGSAASLLMMLLGSGDVQGQMDQANRAGLEAHIHAARTPEERDIAIKRYRDYLTQGQMY